MRQDVKRLKDAKKSKDRKNFKDAKFKIRDVESIKMPEMSKLSSFQKEILGWILRHN